MVNAIEESRVVQLCGKDSYQSNGIQYVENMFAESEISLFEKTINHLTGNEDGSSLLDKLRRIENNDREAFYQLCTRNIWFTTAGLRLISHPGLTALVADAMNCEPGELSPVGHALFWNDPACQRLHYRWHQEASYYPDMSNVISVWFPLVYDLKEESGPMEVALGSHTGKLAFNRSREDGSVTQLQVSDEDVNRFEVVPCVLNRGDGVIFHQNLVHRTGENLTDRPRLSGIIRYANLKQEGKVNPYWDIRSDF